MMDNPESNYNILIQEFCSLNRHGLEFTKKCKTLSHELQSGTLTIVQLVEQLKNLLIHPSPDNRELGILILSQVLQCLPTNLLNDVQLQFICAFYSDRLNDHHQVIPPALKGVLVLLKHENISEDSIKQMLQSLFKNVSCQQQQQSDRYNIYKLFEICFEKKRTEIRNMGLDFIYGVLSAVEGERDPNNLLYLLSWLPSFLKSFSFGHLTEDMFEFISSYFPIDFRGYTEDSNSVTREHLATSLRSCLCAIPEFAEYCFPLVLEKLSSHLKMAKLDSLDVLAEGCETFPVSYYIQHSTDICKQIQNEVLYGTHKEVEQKALESLEKIICKLSGASEDVFKKIIQELMDPLKGNLLPNSELFPASCKMLLHTAKASRLSAHYITVEIVPILINTYNITKTHSHQVMVFTNLIDLVSVFRDVHNDDDISKVEQLKIIPSLCLNAILHEEDEMRSIGFHSLSILAKSLPNEVRQALYKNMNILMVMQKSSLMNKAFLTCLRVMGQNYGDEIQKYVIFRDADIIPLESLNMYLESLITLVDVEYFTEIILVVFLNLAVSTNVAKAQIATGVMKKLLEYHEENAFIQNFLFHRETMINRFVGWILKNIHEININANLELLENISSICKLMIGFQNSETQYKIVKPELERIIALYRSNENYLLLMIIDGLLTRLRIDVQFDYSILDDLLKATIKITRNDLLEVVCQLVANILNKAVDGNTLEKYLKSTLNFCDDNLQDNIDPMINHNVVSLISWITKALIMREHKMSGLFVNKLLDLLETKMSVDAAKGLKVLMNDNYLSMSTKSYCNKRILYRQKLFIEVSNKLLANYKEENVSYLLAMGYLLQEAPLQVFILQFSKILKLVILCLEQCTDSEVLTAVLETLRNLIQNREPVIEEYIQEFLPRLLKLSAFEQSMQVRIKALQCLQYYTQGYPVYKLLPHKQNIIYSLTQCLDDKKRLVRKQAVETRLQWFLLDAPI